MKKMMKLMLSVVLLLSCTGIHAFADDTNDSGCEVLSAPANLHVVGNELVWDAVEGAKGYDVEIYPADYELAYEFTAETKYAMTGHAYITGPKDYTFKVYSLHEDPACNSPITDPATIDVRIREMSLETTSGGTAEITTKPVSYSEPGQGQEGGGQTTKILVADEIALHIIPQDGYAAVIRNAAGDMIEIVDFEADVTLTGLDRFTDDVIYVNFDLKPNDWIIDFGDRHADLIDTVIQGMKEDGATVQARKEGSKLILPLALPFPANFNNVSTYMLVVTSIMRTALDDRIDRNELMAGFCRSQNVSSMKAIVDDMEDTETEVADINYTCYVIWEKYRSDGDKEWTLGNSGDLTFTFKRNLDDKGFEYADDSIKAKLLSTYDCVAKIEVDGKELSEDDHTLAEGSLVLKLKDGFLNGLSVGEHEVKVTFDTGYESETMQGELTASAKLTVKEAKQEEAAPEKPVYVVPKTGIE